MNWQTRIIVSLQRAEPWVPEALVALVCAWLAKCFFLMPSNYVTNPTAFGLLRDIMGWEHGWAWIASTAAVCTAIGMFRVPRCRTAIRCIGLSCACVVCGCSGTSFLLGNPDALSSMPLVVIGLIGLGVLTAWPAGKRGSG